MDHPSLDIGGRDKGSKSRWNYAWNHPCMTWTFSKVRIPGCLQTGTKPLYPTAIPLPKYIQSLFKSRMPWSNTAKFMNMMVPVQISEDRIVYKALYSLYSCIYLHEKTYLNMASCSTSLHDNTPLPLPPPLLFSLCSFFHFFIRARSLFARHSSHKYAGWLCSISS